MRMPGADWRPVRNFTVGGVTRPPLAMVLHTAEGSYEGTISWQNNAGSNVSSYFVVAKDGRIAQCVDLQNRAWTQAKGNPDHVGVEFEGYGSRNEPLTDAQIKSAGNILAWLHQTYGVPIQATDDPRNGRGLIWHGAGGTDWGGHFGCPGNAIVAQRSQILAYAAQKAGLSLPVPPVPAPSVGLQGLAAAAHSLGQRFAVGPILHRGSKGKDVADLQFALVAACGQHIRVDNDFGPATETAVKNVQAFFHIQVDGVVGPKTRSVIALALQRRYP